MEKKTIKRRTNITVETERLLLVKRRGSSEQNLAQRWCAQCAAQVLWVAPETAATWLNVSHRTIYRWLETEPLHFTESAEGCVAICLNSLCNCKPAYPGFTARSNETIQ